MKITQKQKEEFKSIAQTFLAIFIPLAGMAISQLDSTNLTRETIVALGFALLRSAIKALWQVLSVRLTK